MISSIKLEKYIAIISIFDIIISKISYQYKKCLVILFKVNKNLKINFHYIILFLSLAICLKIKDS